MAAPSLPEKVLLLEEGFARRRIPHAFGGALALAYYATPRATIDIDVNVFVPVARAEEVIALLVGLGGEPPSAAERTRLLRDEQTRIRWERTPVDLFFAYDDLHASCLERRRRMPFGDGHAIHVLSAEDLLVFKTLFDREKDRRDNEELVFSVGETLDVGYVTGWLARILDEGDARFVRLGELLSRHGHAP